MSELDGFTQSESFKSFVSHLLELRDRLLRAFVVVIAVFIVFFFFASDIYSVLSAPLTRHLPENTSMLATQVVAPFMVPIKMAFSLALFVTAPYWLYQLWGFVSPGLYQKEKRLAVPLMITSVILFYLGAVFTYFVFFDLFFGIMQTFFTPENMRIAPDIDSYLSFVTSMFFIFGLAFEIPVATFLLIRTGVATPKGLAEKRPYILIGVLVLAMFMTPPDVISQMILAVPMMLLFEAGLIFAKVFPKPVDEDEDVEQNLTSDDMDTLVDNIEQDFDEIDVQAEVAASTGTTKKTQAELDEAAANGIYDDLEELDDDDMEKLFDKVEGDFQRIEKDKSNKDKQSNNDD